MIFIIIRSIKKFQENGKMTLFFVDELGAKKRSNSQYQKSLCPLHSCSMFVGANELKKARTDNNFEKEAKF